MLRIEMLTVEVFKTDVQEDDQARALVTLLSQLLPDCYINFDLDDCDKILRVEGERIIADEIEKLVTENGFNCECLE